MATPTTAIVLVDPYNEFLHHEGKIYPGFANTDLNYQLRQRGVTHLVMAGMIANTCLESTARDARELGFHVTLLSDATAGFSTEAKDAATNLIWPLIVENVTTVGDWVRESESKA
ncbi:hypothetical protein CCUS01_09847 [Colletotrichum cuscutae]|uniref:Isochorismatase-like domain-containing protein n=1 Tax=Colletotrichum cuscutae TaxID=1209917 RepID=A0AAI9UEK7_9PEZI|nr:hypothetical protein CCUS01_09847 [Colletotrichum cuscutae]